MSLGGEGGTEGRVGRKGGGTNDVLLREWKESCEKSVSGLRWREARKKKRGKKETDHRVRRSSNLKNVRDL